MAHSFADQVILPAVKVTRFVKLSVINISASRSFSGSDNTRTKSIYIVWKGTGGDEVGLSRIYSFGDQIVSQTAIWRVAACLQNETLRAVSNEVVEVFDEPVHIP